MSKHTIHLDSPNLGDLEKEYLIKCIDSGFVSTYGPFVPEFEKKFANFLNCSVAVSVQSGTAGLHMAIYELGIGEGDEVIIPALTFVATANAVKYVGAKPVFADVDPITWNIDPNSIRKLVNKKTKAIIAVHLYGNPCSMDEILTISRQNNLFLIEDATESLGSKYMGQATGNFGDFGVFSFNGNKIITTGGGGMIVGKNNIQIEHIRFLVNQAGDKKKGNFHSEIGFNLRMTNLEASLGLAQFKRLNEFLQKKKRIRDIYFDSFENITEVRLQQAYDKSEVIWWLNSVIIDTQKIDKNIIEIQQEMQRKGFPVRRIFMPLIESPPYFENDKKAYSNAFAIYKNGLSLPSSTLNSDKNIELSAKALLECLR